ncbi:MAG TPA: amidohydrolase family protein [Acidimicrobiales bacterium]|nr:amidohydrolase family protein [Acidimicrobiales bacterium]
MLLRSARLADGRLVDVRVVGERIAAVEPAGVLTPADGDEVVELDGRLLVPAPAEPHAHLDKALSADAVPSEPGDLMAAIDAWVANLGNLTAADIADRARRAALASLANGCTTIRTHVDVHATLGTLGVEALVGLREELRGLVDLQLVALVSTPTTGAEGAGNRAALHAAIAAGVDVVGGCPHLDPDPLGCLDICLDAAGEAGLPLDLHVDETLDPAVLGLRDLARRVAETGFDRGATASHCVSLGVQPEAVQREIAAEVAAAGVAVVTLPQTNLFLQARGVVESAPRGLTGLRPLLDAGVTVAGGADNVQDPFCAVGRSDPLETAALLVMAGHLHPDEAFASITAGSRAALGLEPVEVAVGAPAELLAIGSTNVREAIAVAPADRIVVHRGRVVARVEQRVELGRG